MNFIGRLALGCLAISAACRPSAPASLGPPTILNTGTWNASNALALEPPPPPNGNRPGDLPRPRSLAAAPGKLVVLDEANQQLALFAAGGFQIMDHSPAYLGAVDLVFDARGALWVLGPAGCGCARRLSGTGAGGMDVAIAPELYPGRLYASGSAIAIESFDGLHALFQNDAPVSIDDQRDTLFPGVVQPVSGLALAVDFPDPPTTSVHLVGRDASGAARLDTLVDVTAPPSSIEALGAGCGDSMVLVVAVSTASGPAHVVTRLDRAGHTLNQGSAPAPANLFGLFRGFTLASDGSLFQFRPEEDHYDVVRWPTGC